MQIRLKNFFVEISDFLHIFGGNPTPWVRIWSQFFDLTSGSKAEGELKDILDHFMILYSYESSRRAKQLCCWLQPWKMYDKKVMVP